MRSKMIFAAMASCLLMSAGLAQAASTVLAEGGTVGPSTTTVTLPGTVLATETKNFTGSGYTGTLVSSVLTGDATNSLGGLTFTYKVSNTTGGYTPGIIDGLQLPGWTGFLTSVGQQGTGIGFFNVFRGLAGLGIDGPGVVDFRWSSPYIQTGQSSQLLIIQTDAKNWTDTSGRVIDGSFAAVDTYGPTAGLNPALTPVPLPPAALLGIPGLIGVIFISRKRRVASL